MRINVNYDDAALTAIPKTGPVVFISNHPYGVLDGVTLTWLATRVRPDTKVLANDVLCQAPEAAANLHRAMAGLLDESPRRRERAARATGE